MVKPGKEQHWEAARGLAALLVMFHHSVAAFYHEAVFGVSDDFPGSPVTRLFTITPLGIVVAAHFAVCFFFVLSGYVLSLKFFGEGAKGRLDVAEAAVKRPFRLAGIAILSMALSWGLTQMSAHYNAAVAAINGSPWFSEFMTYRPDWHSFLADVCLVRNGTDYNPPLWTIKVELIGSFLVYGVLFFFRRTPFRFAVYAVLLVAFQGAIYQGFLVGILFADLHINYPAAVLQCRRKWLVWLLLGGSLVFASFPYYAAEGWFVNANYLKGTFFGYFPPLPGVGGGYSMLGAVLTFLLILLSQRVQSFLNLGVLRYFGRISFALYAIHFVILTSFTSWLFLVLLHKGLDYDASFLLVLAASLVVVVATSEAATRLVDGPSIRAANWIGRCFRKAVATIETQWAGSKNWSVSEKHPEANLVGTPNEPTAVPPLHPGAMRGESHAEQTGAP